MSCEADEATRHAHRVLDPTLSLASRQAHSAQLTTPDARLTRKRRGAAQRSAAQLSLVKVC
jgi:hypothetical protein